MEEKNTNVPVLALRGLTIFPNMLMHFDVERDISVKALEAAMENNQDILLVAQREIATEEPGPVSYTHLLLLPLLSSSDRAPRLP